jgi:hypothetical protein
MEKIKPPGARRLKRGARGLAKRKRWAVMLVLSGEPSQLSSVLTLRLRFSWDSYNLKDNIDQDGRLEIVWHALCKKEARKLRCVILQIIHERFPLQLVECRIFRSKAPYLRLRSNWMAPEN